jgi:predicted DNA-binding transcriptional regulator YafY
MTLRITVENRNAFEQDDTLRASIKFGQNGGVYFDANDRQVAINGAIQLLSVLEADEARQPGSAPAEISLGLSRRVAVSTGDIRALIEQAIDGTDRSIEIDYTDAEGAQTTRTIKPASFEQSSRGWRTTDLLIAFDVDKGEPRTFRLDRITRAEDR